MRKISVFFFYLLISLSVSAQEDFSKNEVSVNFQTVGFDFFPGVSYERILNVHFGMGASLGLLVNLRDETIHGFHLTPHIRWFVDANRSGSGLFVETNTSFVAYTDTFMYGFQEYIHEPNPIGGIAAWQRPEFSFTYFDFDVGVGLGWKFLLEDDWVGTIVLGAGRHVLGNSMLRSGFHLRAGVSFGMRF